MRRCPTSRPAGLLSGERRLAGFPSEKPLSQAKRCLGQGFAVFEMERDRKETGAPLGINVCLSGGSPLARLSALLAHHPGIRRMTRSKAPFQVTLPTAPLMSLTASSTRTLQLLAVHALHLEGLLSGHQGQLLFPGLVISAAAAAAALAAEVTDGRPEPDGDNHDDKDEKDDIFRSHCSASFLGEGDAAPRRTSPSRQWINVSSCVWSLGHVRRSVLCTVCHTDSRCRLPPVFWPDTGKTGFRR